MRVAREKLQERLGLCRGGRMEKGVCGCAHTCVCGVLGLESKWVQCTCHHKTPPPPASGGSYYPEMLINALISPFSFPSQLALHLHASRSSKSRSSL